jgi:hypothetical protein
MVAVDEALRPEPILWKPDMVQAAEAHLHGKKG